MFGLTDALLSKIFGVASAVLLIALLSVFGYYGIQTGMLKSSLKEANEKVGTLTTANATLQSANDKMALEVKDQNKRITDMLEVVQKAGEDAAKAVAEARKESDKWKSKYRSILDAPPVSPDVCTDLSVKVDGYLKARIDGGL